MPQPYSEEINQQWKEAILTQRQSKLSIASWCRQSGVADHTFYYWQGKLFPKPSLSRSAFTEALEEKSKPSSKIVLIYREFNIHLDEQFSPSTLEKCLGVLKKC